MKSEKLAPVFLVTVIVERATEDEATGCLELENDIEQSYNLREFKTLDDADNFAQKIYRLLGE